MLVRSCSAGSGTEQFVVVDDRGYSNPKVTLP